MASLSEMVQYAQAKQAPDPLAEITKHFIVGADAGYDAGKKAKLQAIDHILKVAQASEAEEKAKGLKIQNDLWTGIIDQAKGQGDVPLTAGETMNGRVVGVNSVGTKANATKSNSMLLRLAQQFALLNPDGQVTTHFKFPSGLGEVVIGPKPKRIESSPTAEAREDRQLREGVEESAMKMTLAEDPLAIEPKLKYLRIAYKNRGKDPDKYIPKEPLTVPVNDDPFGVFAKGGK